MRPLCLVFDLDDTLYLERDYVRSGFQAVDAWVSSIGITKFAEYAWQLFESGQRREVFNNVLARRGWDPTPDLVARMVHIYRHHAPRITLLDDAHDCLATLETRRAEVHLALISDGALISQARKVEALELKKRFRQIILTDRWGRRFWKPHPRAFRQVERRVPWCRFVYIADNPAKDFTAPKQLGWSTVRVRRKGGLHYDAESPSDCRPDFVVDSLIGLPVP